MSELDGCPVCYESKDLIKFHCTHCLCYECYIQLKEKKCPMCRAGLVDLGLVGSVIKQNDNGQYFCSDCNTHHSRLYVPQISHLLEFESLYPEIRIDEGIVSTEFIDNIRAYYSLGRHHNISLDEMISALEDVIISNDSEYDDDSDDDELPEIDFLR